MIRRMRQLVKIGLFLCLFCLFSAIVVFAVSIAPIWGDALLCIDIDSRGGEKVKITMPLSLADATFNLMPKEIRQLCNELEITPDMITDELKTAVGQDLVSIKGDENIRIYVKYVKNDVKAEGFVKIYVKEGGRNGHTFNIWIPRGLLSFSGQIVKTFGLADKYVELPPEITNLRVVENREL